MEKIEHIGVAVSDLDKSTELYTLLLGKKPTKSEVVDSEGVKTVFFEVGETKIELLGATNENSPIAKFLDKRSPGVHHIAFHVNDINEKIAELESKGFHFISSTPKKGADNKLICFLHPKGTNGVLIELCQDI